MRGNINKTTKQFQGRRQILQSIFLEVMSKAELTPEYRAIEKYLAYALEDLAFDPVSIALNLESAEFISRSVVQRMTESGASKRDKAKELLGYVLKDIEINSSIAITSRKYQSFKDNLLKGSSRETLAEILDKTYEGKVIFIAWKMILPT